MKKTLAVTMLAAFATIATAQRTGTMNIADKMCQYDTIAHRHIGPGTIYSKYQFPNIRYNGNDYKMTMHLIEIDKTNPYVKFSPYLSKDSYYTQSRQSDEMARMKKSGLKPIASAMGGGFIQSNQETSTTTKFELYNTLVKDGKTLFDDGCDLPKFYVDAANKCRIANTRLNASAVIGGSPIAIGQINHHRDVGDAKQQVSLFCNGIPKSLAADASTGVDVRVKVESNNGSIIVGKENRCSVVEVLQGCGHTVGSGEAILSAGTSADATALSSLHTGDEITISVTYDTDEIKGIEVMQQVTEFSGHGTAISKGTVIPVVTKHTPGTVIGCSADGNTLYIGDLETSSTSDAPYNCLAYALANIGLYDAIWLDGGPSAEMTVDGAYVTTYYLGSGFTGRYIPSALVIQSIAPDDATSKVLTSLEVGDPSVKRLYVGESFTPTIYGYNQYGEVVTQSAVNNSAVTITCTDSIGSISDGTFTATAIGRGNVRITLQGSDKVIEIPVIVTEAHFITVQPKKVFTGEGRACQISAMVTERGIEKSLDPSNLTWQTDASIVIKSCNKGLITPNLDGVADVYAYFDDMADTLEVTVENLPEETDIVNYHDEVAGKTTINKHLVSVPTSFCITAESAPGSSVTAYYTTGDSIKTATATVPDSGKVAINVTLDYDDIKTYPVSINYISGDNSVNLPGYDTPYIITELTAYYHGYEPEQEDGIDEVYCQDQRTSNTTYNIMGAKVSAGYRGIVIRQGHKYIVR